MHPVDPDAAPATSEMVLGCSAGSREPSELDRVTRAIVDCDRCPRLVTWREDAATARPRAYADDEYWARPVPGFGDPNARLYALGMATAAHGGNRTGRAFTGNSSATWLVAALQRAGLANQASSTHRGDGLKLHEVWMGSAVRCAPPKNRPKATERANCLPHLKAEVDALPQLRVVMTLGQFAWRCAVDLLVDQLPLPKFSHGAEAQARDGLTVLASYHPSRQNTNTGRLTRAMLDDVIRRGRHLANIV